MTLQQIFDQMLTRMRAQGKPAVSRGSCQYQTPEGLHCVVGCMMPDSLISGREQEMRGKPVSDLPDDIRDYLTETLAEGDRGAMSFYRSCQRAHDSEPWSPMWPETFERNMQNVAIDFGLTYTPAEAA